MSILAGQHILVDQPQVEHAETGRYFEGVVLVYPAAGKMGEAFREQLCSLQRLMTAHEDFCRAQNCIELLFTTAIIYLHAIFIPSSLLLLLRAGLQHRGQSIIFLLPRLLPSVLSDVALQSLL